MQISLQQVKELVQSGVNQALQYQNKPTRGGNQEGDYLSSLQKSAVLQESKCFSDSQPNFKKCRTLLSQLIYLINQGETFTDTEGQNLFFSVTKLLSHNNMDLRRMIYLMIKEFQLENSMYIVTASLIKDISSKQDLYRINALRTIHLVLDPSNLVSVERLIKSALIDKNYAISSAALLSGIQLQQQSQEIVKKWQSEVVDRLSSKYVHNHFHAIILLHEIKKQDRNSFTKVIVRCVKENFKMLASVQLIRFVKEVLQNQEIDEGTEQVLIDYLNRQAHKSNESVIFEACKALCELKHLSNKELASVVSVLSMFFQSLVSVNRFMALKILNKLISNPTRRTLITDTEDISSLLSDPNKSISSLAVSILLKLCQESNIDKLLTQIYDNLADMSDEFKIDILKSIKSLVKAYPKRAKTVLSFLFNCLKSEGTYEFKKAAIDIIEMIINDITESKEQALNYLAEYIEDCQYQNLQIQVLSILNREASRKNAPPKIIRFVNNRIHLEEAEVRAASVGIIGKFGQQYPNLKPSMINLLKQTTNDLDEEVRERGNFYLQNLESESTQDTQKIMKDLAVINLEELDKIEAFVQQNLSNFQESKDEGALDIENIQTFASENKELFQKKKVQEVNEFQDEEQFNDEQSGTGAGSTSSLKATEMFEKYSELFSQNEIFADYGPLRKISKEIELTDKDCEYEVFLHKFFFDYHIVLEYQVKNKIENRNLKDVSVEVIFDNENMKELHSIHATEIQFDEKSNILIGVAINDEERIVPATVQNILHFTIEELDGSGKVTSSYEDDFQIEDFGITVAEYFSKFQLEKGKFQLYWDGLKQEAASNNYLLNYQNTDFTVKEIIKHFGISVCDNTDQVKVPNKPHQLLLSGNFLNSQKILIQIMTAYDSKRGGCPLKIAVKSVDPELSEQIANCISQ